MGGSSPKDSTDTRLSPQWNSGANNDATDRLLKEAAACLSQISFGGICGYTAGYALRTIGKVATVIVGAGFCFLQTLAYAGYVQVDWRRIQRDCTNILDLDRDGSVSESDLHRLLSRTKDALLFQLPASAGFVGGLMYGLGTRFTTATGVGVVGSMLLPRVMIATAAAPGFPSFALWAAEIFGVRDEGTLAPIDFRRLVADRSIDDLLRIRDELTRTADHLTADSPTRARVQENLSIVDAILNAARREERAKTSVWSRIRNLIE